MKLLLGIALLMSGINLIDANEAEFALQNLLGEAVTCKR